MASNAARVPAGTGSGIDQCSQSGSGVELLVGAVAHRDRQRRRRRDGRRARSGVAVVRSSPARRPAATAPGWTRRPGGCRRSTRGAPVIVRPQGGGELGAGRVGGAHEQHRLRLQRRLRAEVVEARRAGGGRSGGGRRRWSGCVRSARRPRGRRGGGRAGSTGSPAAAAAPAATDPRPSGRRRSPDVTAHRARRAAVARCSTSTPVTTRPASHSATVEATWLSAYVNEVRLSSAWWPASTSSDGGGGRAQAAVGDDGAGDRRRATATANPIG